MLYCAQNCNQIQVYSTVDPFTSIYEQNITVKSQFRGFLNVNGAEGFVTVSIIQDRPSGNEVYNQTFGQNAGDFIVAPVPINLGPGPFGDETYLIRYQFVEGISIYGGAEVNLTGEDCEIYGNSVVTTGTIEHYIFNNGNPVNQPNWTVNGGTVVNATNPHSGSTSYEAEINFHETGNKIVRFRNGEEILGSMNLTVNYPANSLRIQGPVDVVQGQEVVYSFDNGNVFTPQWLDWSYKIIDQWNVGTTYYVKLKWFYEGQQELILLTTEPEIFLDEMLVNVVPSEIQGNGNPYSGSIEHYTYDRGRLIDQPAWQVSGGEIINIIIPSGESSLYEVDVNWIDTGNQQVSIMEGAYSRASKNIVVGPTPQELSIQGPINVNLNEISGYFYSGVQISPNWESSGTIMEEWSVGDIHYVNVVFHTEGSNFLNIRNLNNQNVFLNGIEINVVPSDRDQPNYIKTTQSLVDGIVDVSVLEGISPIKKRSFFQYFDGLGRLIQTVNKLNSPKGFDVVVPVTYDQYGRKSKEYLPVTVMESNGLYKERILDEGGNYSGIADNFYDDPTSTIPLDTDPYVQVVFEPSPLNRVLKQGAPGSAWQPDPDPAVTTDRVIHYSYEVNSVGDHVRLWTVDQSSSLPNTVSDYPANQLTKTVTTDEEGHAVIEFVDKLGQTILKRVQAVDAPNMSTYVPGEWADTYYIYDDFGDLRYVLPPEAVNNIDQYLNSQ